VRCGAVRRGAVESARCEGESGGKWTAQTRGMEEEEEGKGGGSGAEVERLLFEALVNGTKASNSFPGEADNLEYFARQPQFRERVAGFRDRIVKIIMDIAASVDSSDELFNLSYLRDADPADPETFEPISNVIELLLENVDSHLEEARVSSSFSSTSSSTRANNDVTRQNKQSVVSKGDLVREVRAGLHGVITHANMERPQLSFKRPVDNSRAPFKPLLKQKPHAIESMPEGGYRLIERQTQDGEEVDSQPRYPHPFQKEIQASLPGAPEWIFEKTHSPGMKRSFEDTPCTWVHSKEKLNIVTEALRGEEAFAVDLENHSYRSYQGFVCLMQISTRKEDFLIDTIALREDLQVLNEFFCDPKIVKVLHGADSDVLWLQRDLGLYLVLLFDTGQAARALEYSSPGLAFVLKKHCDIRVNKAFQLADWRLRPLTEEMYKYARQDTHYLLTVFDKLRNELLATGGRDAVSHVLKRSAEVALNVYEKPVFTPLSYKNLIDRKNLRLSPAQMEVFAAVYSWRDSIARREDESVQYVLPDRMLIRVAKETPISASDLERCCNPLPPVVQTRVTEILAVVRSAHEAAVGSSSEQQDKKHADKNDELDFESELKGLNTGGASQVQIGLNSSKSSFVPIPTASFADAARNGSFNRRNSGSQEEEWSRSTSSPVLNVEQLYDMAGWRQISDPVWRAQAMQRAGQSLPTQATIPEDQKQELPLHEDAEAIKARIGQEQLASGAGFGALTPIAKHFSNISSAVASTVGRPAAMSIDRPTQQSADTDDIETPPDADALESEDRESSLREIFRISNKNRKRNKDKKKEGSSSGKDGKKKKEPQQHQTQSQDGSKASGEEDAIKFMQGVGWWDSPSRPVPSLTIEGAPDQPSHLAGAGGGESNGTRTGQQPHHHQQKPAMSSRGGRGGHGGHARRNIPSSPNRKPVNSQGSVSRQPQVYRQSGPPPPAQQQQQQQQQSRGGFSYSQVAASNAGVKTGYAAAVGGGGSSLPPPQRGNSSQQHHHQQQQQQQYRALPQATSRSMTYK